MPPYAERASEVRQHFSEFIDTVERDRPKFVVRNRDVLAALNPEHLDVLLSGVMFHARIMADENGEFVGTLDEIEDIVTSGSTRDEVLDGLAKELVDYADEYLSDSFRLYFYSPNRRSHFPYVPKVAMQSNLDEVKRLIHDEHAEP